MPKDYELIYIVVPQLDQAGLEALGEEVSKQIQQLGGAVDNVRTSDIRQLAYEIAGQTEGIYVVVNFHSETSAIAELEQALVLNQQVLRHMVIRLD